MNLNKFILTAFLALPGSFLSALYINTVQAADIVPNEIMLPGTQPNEVSNFESPNKCDNCHAGYNGTDTVGHPQDEPATGWRGAAMGNAGRDPIFWATMAIAEQDFDGAGDLCIRCHSTGGWYGGRSTPTDASGLAASDSDGVDCDTCHSMTNPDNTEHLGVMNSPFIANCDGDADALNKCATGEGFYGSGMTSMWSGSDKLGPYSENDADARHQFMQSKFHRSVDFCGTCHDVSNSAVGDLAPGNGAQPGNPHSVVSSWDLGLTVDVNGTPVNVPDVGGRVQDKAAFNNPPYAYGVVERTFSEYKASAFPTTLVSDFNTLPSDLQVAGGSLETTYQAALLAGKDGNYEDGDPRYFSCQSCHMRPVESAGANKRGVKIRKDLPQHDHTGGNYWLADMIKYQDSQGHLRLGGDLSVTQVTAIGYGQQRAVEHLQQAASLLVEGNNLKVVNLTGHKLISGYPEGRRMWLNIKWYDADNNPLREDGAYGPLVDGNGDPVMIANPAGGADVQVESIMDLNGSNTRIYEAHYSMTKEWADVLLLTGRSADFVLSYDRSSGTSGTGNYTLGQLAAQGAGTHHETFHFALNNYVSKDNRIPPYGMRYDEAQKRNALPVPDNQYGGNGTGSIYQYWDQLDLDTLKPTGAVSAEITLYYQGTSWEYIQFLNNANDQQNTFLGQEGVNMLEAWINAEVPVAIEVNGDRKMVPPVIMASTTWGTPPGGDNTPPVANDDSFSTDQDTTLAVTAPGVLDNDSDAEGNPLSAALASSVSNGTLNLNANGSFDYTPSAGFTGTDSFSYRASDGTALSAIATVTITVAATGGGQTAGVDTIQTGLISGKGNNKTFTVTTIFSPGDEISIRSTVHDNNGNPVTGATVSISITGPDNATITSDVSDANGIASASWKTSNKGKNPTAPGTYTVTVTNVTANGYTWNNTTNSTSFTLQ